MIPPIGRGGKPNLSYLSFEIGTLGIFAAMALASSSVMNSRVSPASSARNCASMAGWYNSNSLVTSSGGEADGKR
jgi:hypothetical protein